MEQLLQKQASFAKEIEALRQEIEQFKTPPVVPTPRQVPPQKSIPPEYVQVTATPKPADPTPVNQNLEAYIGENLISKIGIVVLVLGVVIGIKYVIDHNLISPLIRVILGYLTGFSLLFLTSRLKHRYLEYSVALLSGAMCILYFTTFAAYWYYHLFPFAFSFGLMLVFVVFTVLAAMYFNRSFVALLGLVGAYVLPFLLDVHFTSTHLHFPYLALVNLGILSIAFSRNWKWLNVITFVWTWIIFGTWYVWTYSPSEYFLTTWIYLSIFFLTFYGTFLAYKLNKLEPLHAGDVILLSANALFYLLFGIELCETKFAGDYSGLVTALNAGLHFLIAYLIHQQGKFDPKIARFLNILGWCFVTLAIPLQFDGIWTLVFWTLEAGLLFAWGRIKMLPFLEIMAYVVLGLAGVQAVGNWGQYVYDYPPQQVSRIFNTHFGSSLLLAIILAEVNYFHHHFILQSPWKQNQEQNQLLSSLLGVGLVLTVYFTFFCEISAYWIQAELQYEEPFRSGKHHYYQEDLESFRWIWSINYTLFFIAALSGLNWFKIKSRDLASFGLGLQIIGVLAFFALGIYLMNGLHKTYVLDPQFPYYVVIRYVSMLFLGMLLVSGIPYLWQYELNKDVRVTYALTLYISILGLVSNEIVLIDTTLAYKLGLSLWWGIYALMMVVLGIWKRIPHARIAGIILFGITLVKLFFYDIEHLATIPKTIIFVALGVLLLLVSFLYNRYKEWLNPGED